MTSTSIPFRLMFSSPAWLPQLEKRLKAAKEHWELCLLAPPFSPGGYTAWVARASLKDGREIVLKIGDEESCRLEAMALRKWEGSGASVQLIDDMPGALLLEHVEGATYSPSAENLPAVVSMCRKLWMPHESSFPLLSARVDLWQDELSLIDAGDPLLPYLRELGQRKAPRSADGFLIHGDLHKEHIFLTDRGMVAIDPDPLSGDRAFDVEPLLRAALDEGDTALARRTVEAFVEVGLDRDDILGWALLRSIYYAHLSEGIRREVWLSRLEQLVSLS